MLFMDLFVNIGLIEPLFIFVGPIKRTTLGWKNVQTYPRRPPTHENIN